VPRCRLDSIHGLSDGCPNQTQQFPTISHILDKNSAIATLNELDKENFDNLVKGLDTIALLPDDVERLYVQHQEAIRKHLASSEARGAGALYVLCRNHL
jgi:hypothetical protein